MQRALTEIKTLRALYIAGEIKPALAANIKYKTSGNLLDRVSLYQGTITELEVDAIVNAANRSLLGGGGVDGAIHRAAGRQLLAECRKLGGCPTGDAKITNGYNLPAKHVIHTVGPVYDEEQVDKSAKLLASCYRRSLELAVQNSLKHVAFPSISTGLYGYPVKDATDIAINEVRQFLDSESGTKLDRVIFVVWGDEDKLAYERLLPIYFPLDEATAE
ncbi:A1pp-domain-containing protein [Irpex rosettiformis]|uniref:A1pp-domain-containing protein n=1 Tax=Irpex rosettiformis TaxID=378272 RepID=A0ACB8TQ91_9APHY|nr:A1pp-domain-containing protein [Irpex rosettiformis]